MAVLDATDVLAHPTEMDAFPTALLEASAARAPILATAVGGIPEIVRDGEPRDVLTASLVREVFGAGLDVISHDGRPFVLPAPDAPARSVRAV